jgi:hypothetical protein
LRATVDHRHVVDRRRRPSSADLHVPTTPASSDGRLSTRPRSTRTIQ